MRRVLPALLFLVFVTPSFADSAIATEERSAFENLNLNVWSLKLAIMKDGKRIGSKIVNYGIYKVGNKWEGHWSNVRFSKSSDGNSTFCTLYHYSTKEGALKNIKVTPHSITFDLEPSPNAFGESAKVIIIPPQKNYPLTPIVRVTAVNPDGIEDWVITERIILASPEIWGHPDPPDRNPKMEDK